MLHKSGPLLLAQQCSFFLPSPSSPPMRITHNTIAICFSLIVSYASADAPKPILVDCQRIWDKAPHNAFTDLLRHNDRWYCVFREGSKHVSPDGSLRVLTSKDGENWESLALVTHPDDLRDAKISVTPDGRLMLNGAAMRAQDEIRYHSMVWFSDDDGKSWTDETVIGDPGFWLWRVQWHHGTAYTMGYRTDRDRTKRILRFYAAPDGVHYKSLIDQVNIDKGVGEDSIAFLEDESALCLIRHETGDKAAFLGKSRPPYTDWTWTDLGVRIGGPKLLQLPDGRFIAAVRLYDRGTRTSLCWLDPDKGTLTETLKLPSGGDTSYAGMVWHDDLLWVSYYSSHEEKTSVYLAKVRIPGLGSPE